MKTLKVTAAVIEKDQKILIARRLKGEQAGLWEFPGGKYEKQETGEQTIVREIKEEFDADIRVRQYLCRVEYPYDSFYLVMDCYICELLDETLVLHDHSDIRWIDPQEENIDWVPADRLVIAKYREYLRG